MGSAVAKALLVAIALAGCQGDADVAQPDPCEEVRQSINGALSLSSGDGSSERLTIPSLLQHLEDTPTTSGRLPRWLQDSAGDPNPTAPPSREALLTSAGDVVFLVGEDEACFNQAQRLNVDRLRREIDRLS